MIVLHEFLIIFCWIFLVKNLVSFQSTTSILVHKKNKKHEQSKLHVYTHKKIWHISLFAHTHTHTHPDVLLRQISTYCLDHLKPGRLSRCMCANMHKLPHRCVSGWMWVLEMNWVVCSTLMKGQSAYALERKSNILLANCSSKGYPKYWPRPGSHFTPEPPIYFSQTFHYMHSHARVWILTHTTTGVCICLSIHMSLMMNYGGLMEIYHER